MRPRILFVSGRETSYMRNRVLIHALQQHFDMLILSSNARSTIARTLFGLARFVANRQTYDCCFVGFYGHPLAIALAAWQRATRLTGKSGAQPIVFDAYVSTFDTLCEDRGWFKRRSLAGQLARWLDRHSCRVADRVLLDTKAHVRYFADQLGIPEGKLQAVYVGCDESLFCPQAREPRPQDKGQERAFQVFYYGAFLALHGTEVIIQAAQHLQDRPDIRFVIGGDGPRARFCRAMAGELGLKNIEFVGWIPLEQLPGHIAQSSLCLGGHFSTIPKAARVISTKTFQFIAMQRATIVGDNAATRELFTHGQDVYAVPMGDPAALAGAIRALADDSRLCAEIAQGGHTLFQQRLTTRAIGNQLQSIISEVL